MSIAGVVCYALGHLSPPPTEAATSRRGGDPMPDTLTDPATIEATAFIDDMLRLVSEVKAQKHRDPMRALQDRLLEIRSAG